MKNPLRVVVIGTWLGLGLPALAHAGVGAGGFWEGILHPFHGLDHLAAMVAVGLWAGQLGGRLRWVLPFTFVGLAAVGWTAGVALGAWSWAETGILVSLAVLGSLVALAYRLPGVMATLLVGLFAFFHGYAHGVETPAQTPGAFAVGFLTSTLVLHLSGLWASFQLPRYLPQGARLVQGLGLGVALLGAWLFLGT